MTRFRFRYSIRALGILVTLVGVYFGLWEVTNRFGVTEDHSQLSNLDARISDERSPMPFVVSRCENEGLTVEQFMDPNFNPLPPKRRFYFWLFGLKCKLPFESECS